MWNVDGERDGARADALDHQLLSHCARFEAAHADWLARIEAEAEEDVSAALGSVHAEWMFELARIRATKARSLPGIEAKLAIVHALRTWKDPHDLAVFRMHEEVCREREELGPSADGERWPFGVPPEPLRSWLNMFGGSSRRRRPPDWRSQHRRSGSQD